MLSQEDAGFETGVMTTQYVVCPLVMLCTNWKHT